MIYNNIDLIIEDELENYCPKCCSANISNEEPPIDDSLELTCHDCSHQWIINYSFS